MSSTEVCFNCIGTGRACDECGEPCCEAAEPCRVCRATGTVAAGTSWRENGEPPPATPAKEGSA